MMARFTQRTSDGVVFSQTEAAQTLVAELRTLGGRVDLRLFERDMRFDRSKLNQFQNGSIFDIAGRRRRDDETGKGERTYLISSN